MPDQGVIGFFIVKLQKNQSMVNDIEVMLQSMEKNLNAKIVVHGVLQMKLQQRLLKLKKAKIIQLKLAVGMIC